MGQHGYCKEELKTMSKKLRSPITWFGGKGAMAAKLLGLMPPHKFYVEPFGGGASLLFAKEPSAVETYNDADEGLVNFFRVIRDPELFNMFYHLVLHTPFSRAEYNYCRETWANETDPVIMAYKWFVVARNSFAGNFGASWGYGVTSSNRGMASQASRLLSIFELLPAIHARIMRVQIEHDSWEKVLARHNHPDTLAYLDPPYIPDTRKSGGYAHERRLRARADRCGPRATGAGHHGISRHGHAVGLRAQTVRAARSRGLGPHGFRDRLHGGGPHARHGHHRRRSGQKDAAAHRDRVAQPGRARGLETGQR